MKKANFLTASLPHFRSMRPLVTWRSVAKVAEKRPKTAEWTTLPCFPQSQGAQVDFPLRGGTKSCDDRESEVRSQLKALAREGPRTFRDGTSLVLKEIKVGQGRVRKIS